jgi:hypothetical protein
LLVNAPGLFDTYTFSVILNPAALVISKVFLVNAPKIGIAPSYVILVKFPKDWG